MIINGFGSSGGGSLEDASTWTTLWSKTLSFGGNATYSDSSHPVYELATNDNCAIVLGDWTRFRQVKLIVSNLAIVTGLKALTLSTAYSYTTSTYIGFSNGPITSPTYGGNRYLYAACLMSSCNLGSISSLAAGTDLTTYGTGSLTTAGHFIYNNGNVASGTSLIQVTSETVTSYYSSRKNLGVADGTTLWPYTNMIHTGSGANCVPGNTIYLSAVFGFSRVGYGDGVGITVSGTFSIVGLG